MNANVQKLIDAMFYLGVPPTRDEIEKACELIYRVGKNDGAMEQIDRMLAATQKQESKHAD